MPAQIVDLFCGIGGLTRGLINSGLNVIAGYDINVGFDDDATRILMRCAPCQLFSSLGKIHITNPTHNRNAIHAADFIRDLPPIQAGGIYHNATLHRSASLSDKKSEQNQAFCSG